MAVKISLSIKQNSQSNSGRTSNVTVTLRCSWTYGSWNHLSPSGSVTINGDKYTFSKSFNPNRTNSGSQELYSKTLNILHGTDGKKTLSCSASFATGVSSGTVKASASKTLTPIASTSPKPPSGSTTKSTNKPIITAFDVQKGTDKTMYATWTWTKDHTDSYSTTWYYGTGNGIWFVGQRNTGLKDRQDTYSAPSNAKDVRFKVKAVSTKHTVNKKETSWWTGDWSTAKTYSFSSNNPTTPPVPTVEVNDYKLTAELANLNVNADTIEFQIVKDDTTVFKTGTASIKTTSASYSCTVTAGSEYKVRCRAKRGSKYSSWSDYSSNVETIPAVPTSITTIKAMSETSVFLAWSEVKNAKTYDIEYATEKRYFEGSDMTTVTSGIENNHYEKTGLETGKEYFFRVRAVNNSGESGWSEIKSIKIGKKPVAPTTWSSSTTVITGEPLILYWIHNSEDGSSQTYGEVEITVGSKTETYTVKNSTEEDEKDKTSFYEVNTGEYKEGTQIKWRVRTAGVTLQYGEWSVQRTVDIYAPPTLELSVTDVNGAMLETLTSFPFYIEGFAGPNTQAPIGYHLTITASEGYETVDAIGNPKIVNPGEKVYSKYFDTSDTLTVEMTPGNIDLENDITYKVTCVVSMNSGLTAETSSEFVVAWTDDKYEPNAEVSVDFDNLSASIRPYCEDEENNLIEGITLSVYRRDYDGSFIEIAKGVTNTSNTFVTDPHPALDYARYRIVATTDSTGAVSFYDLPNEPVGEPAIVIQWDEKWSNFTGDNEDELVEQPWSGSMLKLPYNIDVSDSHDKDASLIEYIGRKHPVTYYGTQLGITSSWSTEIPKDDKETLYCLRRLAIYQGDVYVREPSGSGYWANISVSFSQTHCELTIPVSFEIARVEGGI